ncbi:hypothetical protein LCGC14_0995600 [marine sediment metagenome]|uniref:HK97 gp10 family phage protein n=1 Tax=marine sediment metagenome TaxID=412755 RepID=A0A0F9N947_9ZZZZ
MARPRGILSFEWSFDSLTPALKNAPRETQAAVAQVIEKTTDRAFRIVKNRTPVNSGNARRGWRKESRGTSGRVFNAVDYINVLEFGPYPVTSANRTSRSGGIRRGGAILGGAPPARRTQRAPGGEPSMRSNVSRQAPQGMVRKTLKDIEPRFVADLTDAINSLPSWTR